MALRFVHHTATGGVAVGGCMCGYCTRRFLFQQVACASLGLLLPPTTIASG